MKYKESIKNRIIKILYISIILISIVLFGSNAFALESNSNKKVATNAANLEVLNTPGTTNTGNSIRTNTNTNVNSNTNTSVNNTNTNTNTNTSSNTNTNTQNSETTGQEVVTEPNRDDILKVLDKGAGGIVNFIIMIIRILVMLVLLLLEFVLTLGNGLSLDAILFNEIGFINLDFMTPKDTLSGYSGVLSTLSAFVMVGMLLIIAGQFIAVIVVAIQGLQGSMSGKPQGLVKIKESLVNWFMSLVVMLFIIGIAVVIVNLNTALVKVLKSTTKTMMNTKTIEGHLIELALFGGLNLKANIAFLMYVVLKVQAIILFVYYARRAFSVLLSVVTAPLIAGSILFGSIGLGTNAFPGWVKNFMARIFIQLFHILIYLILVGTMLIMGSSFDDSRFTNNLLEFIPLFILILGATKFLFVGEAFVKKFFPQVSATEGVDTSAVFAMGLVGKATGLIKSGASKVKGFVPKTAKAVNFEKPSNITPRNAGLTKRDPKPIPRKKEKHEKVKPDFKPSALTKAKEKAKEGFAAAISKVGIKPRRKSIFTI